MGVQNESIDSVVKHTDLGVSKDTIDSVVYKFTKEAIANTPAYMKDLNGEVRRRHSALEI